MNRLYAIAKKIHRIMVLVMTTFLLLMGLTGLALKYPGVSHALKWIAPPSVLRSIHNSLSPLFVIALFLMVVTGLTMYFLPLLMRRRARLASARRALEAGNAQEINVVNSPVEKH